MKLSTSKIAAATAVLATPALAIPNADITRAARQASISSSVSSLLSAYSSSVQASASATPTSTPQGAISTTILAASVAALPPDPNATSYPRDGLLHGDQPAPYTPSGGMAVNGSEPIYVPQSDFDYESLALGLYQEYIELDLFHHGLAMFSDAEFEEAGLNAEDRFLIEFMADQEVGHAVLISNMLGASAPQQCSYQYPFKTVREFFDFSQKLTRYGESGVYGFLPHMNSVPAATLLHNSIATEARQQLIFRQFEGLFPMPFYFVPGIPQSWQWTLLAPHITSCPANQTRLIWQNFPALNILNNPNATDGTAAITHNRSTPLSEPGREVYLSWEEPGKPVGPDLSYITNTTAGAPAYVAWVSQLNVTYSALTDINGTTGKTIQPNATTLGGIAAINGTVFIAITDSNLTVTPANITMINPHVVAGPALYQSG